MTTIAETMLWGTRIGVVSLNDGDPFASFEYDRGFLASGIRLSPLTMPNGPGIFRFPGLPREAFHGLPGLLADSLPDKFGNALIDAWLAKHSRTADSFDAVERLCYTGSRGMGALEFRPTNGPSATTSRPVDIVALVDLASKVLNARSDLKVTFEGDDKEDALREILRVGTSAGGARAKAVIAWNAATNEVRSGQTMAGLGFSYWLLKFDGVRNNKDKELADPTGYGVVEYVYSIMAGRAGIEMNACRLLEENGRRHFMTQRFDRTDDDDKLHMQSLAALAHYDFNDPNAYSYEQAFLVMRQLGLPRVQVEQQVRRMVFNVMARNQDDHVKNIAFLMDREGKWRLSPAYDVTWSYNPEGDWTARHQMSVNGKRDDFVQQDLIACAGTADVKPARVKAAVDDVRTALSEWTSLAEAHGVDRSWIPQIRQSFRLLDR